LQGRNKPFNNVEDNIHLDEKSLQIILQGFLNKSIKNLFLF